MNSCIPFCEMLDIDPAGGLILMVYVIRFLVYIFANVIVV